MQMLKDRDYVIVDHDLNMTLSQFKNKYGENMKRDVLTINRRKRGDDSDQIYVFFPDEPEVGLKTMKSYITRMNEENVIRVILVAQQNLTPFAKTSISEICSSGISEMGSRYHLEIFQEAELLKTLLERYTTKETQSSLPRIQLIDPIARYYGLKREQVVDIIQPS
ncbi:hypothetical protein M0R45_035055 [Rubus argutus]|uniref:Uncharacterized protein n=1 Tax=Rubus argutus TaxID=59490 RepID=A0AAW1VSU0_RUBAR